MASYTVHQAPVAAHTVAAAYAPTAAVARPVAAAGTAGAYGGYQPAHAATDYGYAQRQPEVPPPPPPVTSQNYQVKERRNLSFVALSLSLTLLFKSVGGGQQDLFSKKLLLFSKKCFQLIKINELQKLFSEKKLFLFIQESYNLKINN